MTESIKIAAEIGLQTGAFQRGCQAVATGTQGMASKVSGAMTRMKNALSSITTGGMTSMLRQWGGAIAGFAGVYGIQSTIRSVKEFEAALSDLKIFGEKDNAWLDRTRQKMIEVSNATGVAKEQLAAYANEFVEATGDADFAMNMIDKVAKVSVATGANMKDLAGVMEQFAGALKITDSAGMERAFSILTKQALLGRMSFAQMAGVMPTVTGFATSKLGITGEQALKDIGGLLQLTRRVTESPAEAATAARSFITYAAQRYEKFEEITGKSLTAGTTETGAPVYKSLGDISKTIAEAYKEADAEQLKGLNKIFEIRSDKAVAALLQALKGGWGAKVGPYESAEKIFAAGGSEGLIDKMYKQRIEGPGHRMEKSLTNISNAIYQKALPAFESLANNFDKIGWVIRNLVGNIEVLLGVWAAWKATKFFQALAGLAGGGGVGGVTAAATMNVTASVVNVMGGAGVGPGGVPIPGGGAGGATAASAAGLAIAKTTLLYMGAAIAHDVYQLAKGKDDVDEYATAMVSGRLSKEEKEKIFGSGKLGQSALERLRQIELEESPTGTWMKEKLETVDVGALNQAFSKFTEKLAQGITVVVSHAADTPEGRVASRGKTEAQKTGGT